MIFATLGQSHGLDFDKNKKQFLFGLVCYHFRPLGLCSFTKFSKETSYPFPTSPTSFWPQKQTKRNWEERKRVLAENKRRKEKKKKEKKFWFAWSLENQKSRWRETRKHLEIDRKVERLKIRVDNQDSRKDFGRALACLLQEFRYSSSLR